MSSPSIIADSTPSLPHQQPMPYSTTLYTPGPTAEPHVERRVSGGVYRGVSGGVSRGVSGRVSSGVTEGVTGGVSGGVYGGVSRTVSSSSAENKESLDMVVPIRVSDLCAGCTWILHILVARVSYVQYLNSSWPYGQLKFG